MRNIIEGMERIEAATRALAATEEYIRRRAKGIIERDAHVSWSVRRCAYHVISRMKKGRATYRTLHKAARHALWTGAAEGRAANLNLYHFITKGV